MRIPDGPSGVPTVSASQLRVYGAGGFRLDEQEQEQGCPRLYKAKYVDRNLPVEERSYALVYGGVFHEVMHLMEDRGLTPDEAMAEAFDPMLPQSAWTELRDDVERYLSRGATPMDRYGVLGTELELEATLYVDEEFGEVRYRGLIDWLGVDPNLPNVLHSVDYKTNRFPPSQEAMLGDVQFRGYHWLVEQNAHRWVNGPVRIVTHLDAVKFRDVTMQYTPQQIDDWHTWVVAVVRRILRDEEALPVLNSGCAHCPIRQSCPAYEGLPQFGQEVAALGESFADPVAALRWRDDANRTRLLLEKAVKRMDERLHEKVYTEGVVVVGDQRFEVEPSWRTVVDVEGLHRLLGDRFYGVASATKAAVERMTADDPSLQSQALAMFERVPEGRKVVRRKQRPEDSDTANPFGV